MQTDLYIGGYFSLGLQETCLVREVRYRNSYFASFLQKSYHQTTGSIYHVSPLHLLCISLTGHHIMRENCLDICTYISLHLQLAATTDLSCFILCTTNLIYLHRASSPEH